MCIVCPVIYPATSLARNDTKLATSLGNPTLPTGMLFFKLSSFLTPKKPFLFAPAGQLKTVSRNHFRHKENSKEIRQLNIALMGDKQVGLSVLATKFLSKTASKANHHTSMNKLLDSLKDDEQGSILTNRLPWDEQGGYKKLNSHVKVMFHF